MGRVVRRWQDCRNNEFYVGVRQPTSRPAPGWLKRWRHLARAQSVVCRRRSEVSRDFTLLRLGIVGPRATGIEWPASNIYELILRTSMAKAPQSAITPTR